MHKSFIKIISVLFIGIALMVGFSPLKTQAGNQWPMIKVSTIINADPCEVFEYLGNSDNAKDWSVFVDHITLLEGKDGQPGSVRRCFKNKTQQRETWDEEIILSASCKKRRLTVYNLKDFGVEGKGLLTEQLYEKIEDNKCKLSFTLFYEAKQNYFGPLLKLHFFSYKIEHIFQENLNQIQQILNRKT